MTVLITVTGCSTLSYQPAQGALPRSKSELTHWTIRGKILITTDGEKQSGYFYWQQQGDTFNFSVNSFIGSNILSLTSNTLSSELQFDGKTYQDNSPEALLKRLTGTTLPVSHFSKWLLGELTGQELATKMDEQLPKEFKFQNGDNNLWTVKYQQQHVVHHYLLPKTITYQSNRARVKMSISEWEI